MKTNTYMHTLTHTTNSTFTESEKIEFIRNSFNRIVCIDLIDMKNSKIQKPFAGMSKIFLNYFFLRLAVIFLS